MATTMRPTRRKREQFKRLTWLTEAQIVLGWGVILILAALLGAIYLNQASRIASVGRRVQVLQNQLESLKRENAALARQIAETQSLERLHQEAIRLGFVPARPADIEYIIVPDYPGDRATGDEDIAAGGSTAASAGRSVPPETVIPAGPAVPIDTVREAVWHALKAGVGGLVYGEAGDEDKASDGQ
jgi:cell division protein FtsL